MNVDKLVMLREEAKQMTSDEKREKVAKIENKITQNSVLYEKDVNDNNKETYVILPHGVHDITNLDVVLNNIKTREEIEHMVDTQGAINELENILELKTIELSDISNISQWLTTYNIFGCIVSKDFFLKACKDCMSLPEKHIDKVGRNNCAYTDLNGYKHIGWDFLDLVECVNLTSNDCFEDLAVLQFEYEAYNSDTDEFVERGSYVTNTYIVHFNEFCQKVKDLGYSIGYSVGLNQKEFDNSSNSPFEEYIKLVTSGKDEYIDIDCPLENHKKGVR